MGRKAFPTWALGPFEAQGSIASKLGIIGAAMDRAELLRTLEAVHGELASAQEVDDETRELLSTLTSDIRRLSEESDERSAEAVGPLSAQVQELVLRFETDYPRLTAALNQVADALASLGI